MDGGTASLARPLSGGTDHAPSYYAATANPAPDRPALDGETEVDICVVGAGYSGLSTALHLAEKGHRVTVLEGARVGWGASGRNGGQIVNGLNAGLHVFRRRFGEDVARFVADLLLEGGDIIRDRVARYDIECDLRHGNVFAALNTRHLDDLRAKRDLWAEYGLDNLEMLDRARMRDHAATDLYCGGMIDHRGGHLHPLNLALGEAAAIERLGGTIHESTPAISVETGGARPVIRTPGGVVTARTLVLCGNAYLGNLVPGLAKRIMPVSTQVMATEPLGEAQARALMPAGTCVEDVRYILDYYRMSADHRLLFGGGTVYGGTDPKDIKRKLVRSMDRVFPQLRNTRIDHAWSGNFALSFTRVPQLGRIGSNTYFAHGYSGHGVSGSHLFGRILSEAIHGDLGRFDTFAGLPWLPFPGGQGFRVPYSVLGSWWYALRDRLGA
ncbi:FAD-binding oxidoreductase [Palleronia sp. LCG004]|uniref:NAD(P)/FAD-dependent oxidoreductase n=1 Tax=Palleronia sp. LCG004 TaxID=3079304 RepID=UPI002943E797|nr:FAD-binding oxidoreductase [Palleronia sp. LCG004]WOI56277.1 FAD-binding oxidoreductase [Palleronia sp. LCG004]